MSEDQGAIAAGHSAEERQIAEATETAESAQAQGVVATETAVQAGETAQAAAAISVAAGSVAIESADEANATAGTAAVQATEAKQEATVARSEVGELRQWLSGELDSLKERLFPPEAEPGPDSGVEEITLDDTDIGESGNPGESNPESGQSGSTPVHGDSSGQSSGRGANETGTRAGGRRFRRGR